MEQMLPAGMFADLLKLGVAGCFIVYLIVTNWRQGVRYDQLVDSFNEMQERRVEERQKNTEALIESAAAQKEQAEATRAMASAVGGLTEMLRVRRGR